MKIRHTSPLYNFYEKLYFHEIDAREKLIGRAQVPLVIIISMTGVIAFMLQNYEKTTYNLISIFFIIFLAFGSLVLLLSVYFFIQAMHGHTYKLLPKAEETESYKEKLHDTYKDYKNGKAIAEGHLDEYLCKYMIECSSTNTDVNDKRAWYLHKLNGCLIATALLLLLSFLFFYFGDLNKDNKIKTMQVKIINPIGINGNSIHKGKSLIYSCTPINSSSNLNTKNIEARNIQQEKIK